MYGFLKHLKGTSNWPVRFWVQNKHAWTWLQDLPSGLASRLRPGGPVRLLLDWKQDGQTDIFLSLSVPGCPWDCISSSTSPQRAHATFYVAVGWGCLSLAFSSFYLLSTFLDFFFWQMRKTVILHWTEWHSWPFQLLFVSLTTIW